MADESAAETFFRWREEKTSFRRVIGIVFSVIRLATASPSSGGQRVWSVIQRSEDRGQSAQANAEGKWRLELGARSLIQRGICSRYPITITSRSRERAGNRGQGVAERI